MNKHIKNLFYLFIFFSCMSIPNRDYEFNSIFISKDIRVSREEIHFYELKKQENILTPQQWNQYGVKFFYEGEFEYSKYCFLKAISLSSSLELEPFPYALNDTLTSYLNLLFFYESLPNQQKEVTENEEKFYLENFIKLLSNREDLLISSLREIRKRNFQKLEYRIAQNYYLQKENHSDVFYYEYFLVVLNSKKTDLSLLEVLGKIKNTAIKLQIIEEWGFYLNFYKNFKEYIGLYEFLEKNHKNFLNSKSKDSQSSFYIENVFNQYFLNYQENRNKKIKESLYKEILQLQEVQATTYFHLLHYYKNEYFFFTKEIPVLKIKIKNNCNKNNILFYTMCAYHTEIEQKRILKKVFGSYHFEEIQSAKDWILNFY